MERNNRTLEQTKQPKVVLGKGVPLRQDGNDGDIRVNLTSSGIALFIKYAGTWYSARLRASSTYK